MCFACRVEREGGARGLRICGRRGTVEDIVVWFAERVTQSGGVVPAFIDYFAVIVGVTTGAMFACDRRLDIVGTIVCGLLTAYGGGILRDFLLQDQGVYFMSHPYLFLLCIGICFFVFHFRGLFLHLPSVIFLCDTLSVALYAVAGASKAFDCGSGFIMSVVLGAVVGVGGGAIRDSMVGEVPSIFKSSNYYAVAAFGGSLTYVLLVQFNSDPAAAALLCVTVVVLMRYMSVFFDWRTGDDPIDLTPYVSRPLKGLAHVVSGLFIKSGSREKRRARSFKVRRALSDSVEMRIGRKEEKLDKVEERLDRAEEARRAHRNRGEDANEPAFEEDASASGDAWRSREHRLRHAHHAPAADQGQDAEACDAEGRAREAYNEKLKIMR